MERDSIAAAQRFARAALEQSDDAAYVTGKIDAEMRRLKALTEAQRVDELVEKCRELVRLHRDVALFFAAELRWFARHPEAKAHQTLDGAVYTPAFARSEYRLARHQHTRICPQFRHWLDQQARHRATVVDGPIALPPAANSDNPSISRTDAA